MGMTDVQRERAVPPETGAVQVSGLFRARYPEMVRLAGLLGADDPEDIAQEAFARLIRKAESLRDPAAALAYVRSTVCNLVVTGTGTCGSPGCGSHRGRMRRPRSTRS